MAVCPLFWRIPLGWLIDYAALQRGKLACPRSLLLLQGARAAVKPAFMARSRVGISRLLPHCLGEWTCLSWTFYVR